MRNKRVKKQIRLLSLLLCAVMVLGILPVTSASAAEETLTVSQSSVQLPKNSSVTVTAACSAENVTPAYQWQIRVPGAGTWVDISGATGASIKVTYGMVASLMSGSTATIRAKATIGSGTVYTGEVTVNITDPVAAAAPAPSSSAKTFALPRKTTTPAASVDKGALAKKAEEAKAAEAAALEALNQAKAELEPLNQAVADAQQAVTAAQQAVDAATQAIAAANTTQEASADPTGDTSAEETTTAPAKSVEELNAELAAANEALTAANAALEEAKANAAPAQAKVDEAQKAYDAAKAASDQAASTYSAATVSNDATTTYNVVINYAFENGDVAADPYTASLAAGSNFSTTVTFPTIQGYLPYVGEDQKNSYEINITGIDSDLTINVVYKPTNVNYTVIHYQQNVNDDKYTEAAKETKQGLTNSQVPNVAKDYQGFYALLYEQPNIAADGSTVVEVYYDRYYYLMNFDLDGGYGVEPIYARYGSPIVKVGNPTKAGYSFSGWSEGGTPINTLPSEMPASNKTYKALWTPNNTAKVTVVFWGENADDEEYSYIKSAQVDVKPGTEFTYSESGSLICALEEHTHSLDDNCYTLTCTQEVHTHSKNCNTCGETEHTAHTTACYEGVGNKQNVYTDVPNKPVNGQVTDHWRYGKLIYINGSWYRYSGATAAGSIAPTTCHKHSDKCLGCGKTEHTHSMENGCYTQTCGKTEHTHNSNCYMSGAGLDSNLWTFVRSETVTVAADGSSVVNVYYDRTEKTLTFKYNYNDWSSRYQSTETITAKWGSNISVQYKKIAANAGSTFWSAKTNGEGPYTNYFGVMPQASAIYYNRGSTGDEGTMTYWGQDLNGEYTVKLFEVTGVGGYTVTDEDRYEFEGFTYHHGTYNGSSCSGANFYYTRNRYDLVLNNGETNEYVFTSDTKNTDYTNRTGEGVLYEASLSDYQAYQPTAPSRFEPGSVTFGGWYLNPECTGAEYKLDDHTMPADNVLLYAKWVPVTHTVEFYLDKAALDAGTKLSTHPDITVPHGSKVDPAPTDPTNGSYTFIGWFYMENGVEKAFDFANMPVKKDMQVYGKWSSNVLKKYTIYYKIQGTDTEIADPTIGSGLAGITKTFDAKGGTELYAAYQEGYFPVTKSHSLTIDINATEANDTNVFTFWYVQRNAVPYTVKYLNKETGEPVATEKTVSDNRKAVVTETFVPVSGMMPDAYQKRLVVSVDKDGNPDTEHNVIIFYYTEDTTHAYYKITHYTENLAKDAQDNTTWTEYASSQAVGDIGTIYNAEPMTIPGFTYNSAVEGTVASGGLTAKGLELKLYYTRNSYPYQVRYLEQGTGKQLADPKDGSGKYGQVISESAIDIANYEAVTPTSQTLNIKIEESQTEAKLNIITFYYQEREVAINYQVVGPTGCGTVNPTSETLKVLSGTAQGSTPTTGNGFRFVGWYTDEACTTPVDNKWVTDNKLTPVKDSNAVWTSTTYYAKFEYDVTDLTITKELTQTSTKDESFVFTVSGEGINTTVVIKVPANSNTASITISGLKVGASVTVTEDATYNRDYSTTASSQEVTLSADSTKNAVTISNSKSNVRWLSESGHIANWFKQN